MDNLPYIPGHLLIKLPRLSDTDAVDFVNFIQQLACDIDSHYFDQVWRYDPNAPALEDLISSDGPFIPDSDPPF